MQNQGWPLHWRWTCRQRPWIYSY